MDNIIQATYDVPGYSTFSTFVPPPTSSLATDFDPNISSLSQDVAVSFQVRGLVMFGSRSSLTFGW